MMKLIYATAAACLLSTAASASVLDFTGDICDGGSSCGNFSDIDQSYGDIAGQLDVVYDGDTIAAGEQAVRFWNDWDGLDNGVFGYNNGSGLTIDLVVSAGYQITLNSFGVGWDSPTDRTTQVSAVDLADSSTLLDTGVVSNSDAVGTYLVGSTSLTGFSIILGPDSYYSGLGAIDFTVTAIDDMPAVPLPATGWMLMAGLGGLLVQRKRKS